MPRTYSSRRSTSSSGTFCGVGTAAEPGSSSASSPASGWVGSTAVTVYESPVSSPPITAAVPVTSL